jgi:hypothetical protein
VFKVELAALPTVFKVELAALPTVFKVELAALPTVFKVELAAPPTVFKVELAAPPTVFKVELAALPTVFKVELAAPPTVFKVELAALPTVFNAEVATFPVVFNKELATFPVVFITEFTPLATLCPDPFTALCPDPFTALCPDPFTALCPDPFTALCPDPSVLATGPLVTVCPLLHPIPVPDPPFPPQLVHTPLCPAEHIGQFGHTGGTTCVFNMYGLFPLPNKEENPPPFAKFCIILSIFTLTGGNWTVISPFVVVDAGALVVVGTGACVLVDSHVLVTDEVESVDSLVVVGADVDAGALVVVGTGALVVVGTGPGVVVSKPSLTGMKKFWFILLLETDIYGESGPEAQLAFLLKYPKTTKMNKNSKNKNNL